MPRYYRYGAQPYHYQYNWNGQLKSDQKPPMLTFGAAGDSKSMALLPLALLGAGVYFAFLRKDKRGKTFFDRNVVQTIGGR